MSTAALNRSTPGPAGQAPAEPPAGARPAAPVSEEVSQYRWIILIGVMLASIMEVLDTTIINVALPQMAGNLGATTTEIAWVSTGYILSNVVVLPMTAWLAGRFGRKRYLTFSIILFIVASFFCGTSHSLGEIVFWRILQGAGGAALLSTAQATLREIFPRDQQASVQAIFTLGIIVAPTLGPTLGGWMTDNYSWSWTFFINVPIGLLSLFLVSGFLQDSKYVRAPSGVDWPGIALLTVGLGSLQYVLEEGNQDDWFESATITRLAILAGVSLVALVVWELWPSNKNPVVDFRVLKNRTLLASLFLFLTLGFGLYGGVFIFPLFAQTILHFTPTETGLVLLPGGLATGVGVIICGRLLGGPKPKVDPRVLIALGTSIFMWSMWDLGHLTVQSGIPDTQLALILRGLGLGFLFTPINLTVFGSLDVREVQQASGLINLTRQLGGSFGIALIGTYISNQTAFHRTALAQYIYPGNPALLERQQGLIALLQSHGYTPAQAQAGWLGMLNQQVQRQAAVMSFNDAFLMILMTFMLSAPAILLLKRPNKPAAPGADAH